MKKICLIILAAILCLCQDLRAQILHNPMMFGGSDIDRVMDIKQDRQGNIYVLGELDASPTSRTVSGTTSLDVSGPVVAKYDQHGKLLQIVSVGFIGLSSYAMAIDDDGNLLFTGRHSSYTFFAAKLNPQFKLIWSVTEGTSTGAAGNSIVTDKDGNAYVAATVSSWSFLGLQLREKSCCPSQSVLIKFSPEGKVLWVRSGLGDNLFATANSVALDRQGNIIMAGTITFTGTYGDFTIGSGTGWDDLLAVKYSPDGKVLWAKNFGGTDGHSGGHDIAVDMQNNIYLAGSFTAKQKYGSFTLSHPTGKKDALLLKLDANGEVIWAKSGNYTGDRSEYYGIGYSEDKIQVTGYRDATGFFEDISSNPVLNSYTTDGEEIWQSEIYKGNNAKGKKLLITSESTTFMVGEFQESLQIGNRSFPSAGREDIFFTQVLDTARYSALSKIQGQIDLAATDCSEKGPLEGILVKASPGNYYGISDKNGQYTIHIKPGDYTVEPVIPAHYEGYLSPDCQLPSPAPVKVEANYQAIKDINFRLRILQDSPLLSVDIGKSRLRRCFASNTEINYCNPGFSDQENVKLTVVMPPYVVPLESSIPWTERQDSLLIFDIGTLKAGACGRLTIKDSVVCNDESIRGFTQCFKAFLSTDRPPSPAVNIQLTATCKDNGFVRLRILNQGTEHMKDSVAYRIFLDNELVFADRYRLRKSDSLVLNVPVNGRTIHLESDLPSDQGQRSITLEGCGSSAGAVVSKGFHGQFPQDDEPLWVEEFCTEILDSFDPNCKEVSPAGLMDAHYISESATLEYTIRFQNTGTDTAYTVKIHDQLSEYLDLSSLRPGLASHPYALSVSGSENPVLVWEFKNIMLPDSTTNEAESHGFVKFKIRQKEDNEKGSIIKNKSSIFFDYNSPIITNEVFNTVGLPEFTVGEPAQVQNCTDGITLPTALNRYTALCQQDSTVVDATGFNQWFGYWQAPEGVEIENPNAAATKVSKLPYGESTLVWEEFFCDQQTSMSFTITRYPLPEKPRTEVILRPSVELLADGSGIRWYTNKELTEMAGEGNSFKPASISCSEQKFYVTQTINGCESEAEEVSFNLEFKKDDFSIANVITPNGDGKNEFLFIPPFSSRDCLGEFHSMQVMNRWGNTVFSTNNESFEWNGKGVPAGTYFLVLRYAHFTYTSPLTIIY